MYLIDDLETIFNTEFVDMFMVYLHARFYMPKSNDLLAIAIRPIAEYRLFSYILQYIYCNVYS
jgi:hypothetical protein